MQLDSITPVILTYNEAPNIERSLKCVSWANKIVVLDSGSTDRTRELATSIPSVQWEEHGFINHAAQWNYAVSLVETEWILALDADYQVTTEFRKELSVLNPKGHSAFRALFLYCIASKTLHCSIYPPVVVLYRKGAAKYVQDGHTQRLIVNGKTGELTVPLVHDDRKSFRHWLRGQWRYAKLEAPKLAHLHWCEARWPERLRKLLLIMPILIPLYILIVRGGILDGWRGLRYAGERSLAEFMISGRLVVYWFEGS